MMSRDISLPNFSRLNDHLMTETKKVFIRELPVMDFSALVSVLLAVAIGRAIVDAFYFVYFAHLSLP